MPAKILSISASSSGSATVGWKAGRSSRCDKRLAAGLGHGLLHHLGHHRAAIDFAQMLLRHIAGPEALQLRFALELVEPRGQALLELVRRR